jgi:two-component system, NarL family, nitrate/nitrite sensor histidine kinase NarX
MTPATAAPSPSTAKPVDAGAVISTLASELGADSELEPLLERFLVPIVALAGAQAGAVRVLTDDGQYMRLVAQHGLPPQVLVAERMMERDCGLCGVAAGTDLLGWVDDVRACARHGTDAWFGSQCQGVLAISLARGDDVLGMYNLFFESRTEIDAQTETILRLIGQLLGLALYNARAERERLRLTVQKERQEMVNEVHDAIAQTLAFVRMRLPLLSDAMLAHDDQRSLKYFSDIKQAAGEAHDNLREVMTYFRTRMPPQGLQHALQGIAEGFLDRTGIALEIRNGAQSLDLTDEQEVQVFHIVQEALANIAKHSMAKRAVLAISKSAGHIEFVIEDDGRGLAAGSGATPAQQAVPSTPFGLGIMHERARRVGGSVEIGKGENGGTRVRLVMPASTPMEASS